MKKITTFVLLFVLTFLFSACAGGGASVGVYHHHHGSGPWWGSRYYRDQVIVVPTDVIPDTKPDVEATPLPSEPEQMPLPDMGMPDIGGDFDGDMGGDW